MSIPVKSQVPAYIQENGSILINVHIRSMDQFYNHIDPSPEEEMGLNDEMETYISNAVEDLTPEERKQAQVVFVSESEPVPEHHH